MLSGKESKDEPAVGSGETVGEEKLGSIESRSFQRGGIMLNLFLSRMRRRCAVVCY